MCVPGAPCREGPGGWVGGAVKRELCLLQGGQEWGVWLQVLFYEVGLGSGHRP